MQMQVTNLEDRLGAFYKDLPSPVVQRLKDYGFEAEHGQEIIQAAAVALLNDPAEIARIMAGLPLVFQQAVKTKLAVLAQAGEAMGSTSRAAVPEAVGIEAQLIGSIAALKKLMDGEITLDIIAQVNALPFIVADEGGTKPDPEMTIAALRASAMGGTRVQIGGQFRQRLVLEAKTFVPVKVDPFTGRALDEGVAYGRVLAELDEEGEMLVAYMRQRGYLRQLGNTTDQQAAQIYAALVQKQYNPTIDKVHVEWRRVSQDEASVATLRSQQYVAAPGLGGAAMTGARVEELQVGNFADLINELFENSDSLFEYIRKVGDRNERYFGRDHNARALMSSLDRWKNVRTLSWDVKQMFDGRVHDQVWPVVLMEMFPQHQAVIARIAQKGLRN